MQRLRLGVLGIGLAAMLSACSVMKPPRLLPEREPSVADTLVMGSAAEIASAIASGETTSFEMTQAYLDRIAKLDRDGPQIQSVLSLNPNALSDARTLDSLKSIGQMRGPLHGVPILIKDNIETLDPLPTTAGSLALRNNFTERDAPLVAGLRAQGAVILGKTNLSEWANFRSKSSISGWSGLGGQTRNPHVLDRSPCGSSAGSGAATAAGFAAASIGTETNGSVICPSSMNGIVGFKPTVGIISQDLIVPISSTQDTAGPMTRTVEDAALLMNAMATREGQPDFVKALNANALRGKRLGVLVPAIGRQPGIVALFDEAKTVLEGRGAELVLIEAYEFPDNLGSDEFNILLSEFKTTLNAYLAQAAPEVTTRSLEALIAFNTANADRELELFNQDILVQSNETQGVSDAEYVAARSRALAATREAGIDAFLEEYDVDALIAPSMVPAIFIDAIYGDRSPEGTGAGWIAAIAGYPHLTVPMGTVDGLPVGLSFIGTAFDDAEILSLGYAYELASQKRIVPTFLPNVRAGKRVADAMRPYKHE